MVASYHLRSLAIVLIVCTAAVFCQEVTLQETSGEQANDGLVEIGDKFTITCSGPESKGKLIAFFKDQPFASSHLELFIKEYPAHPEAAERFEVVTKDNEDGTKTAIMKLKAGAETSDSGMYGCKAVTKVQPDRDEIDWVTVSVRTPVKEMELYGINAKDVGTEEYVQLQDGESYEVEQGDAFYTKCVASGSNPEAEMTVTFYDEDITSSFKKTTSVVHRIGDVVPVGDVFSTYYYKTTLTAKDPIGFVQDDSHQAFTCTASPPGSPSHSFTVKPIVVVSSKNNGVAGSPRPLTGPSPHPPMGVPVAGSPRPLTGPSPHPPMRVPVAGSPRPLTGPSPHPPMPLKNHVAGSPRPLTGPSPHPPMALKNNVVAGSPRPLTRASPRPPIAEDQEEI